MAQRPQQLDRYILKRGEHFSREQEDYLASASTLTRWAGKSLEERVKLFQRRYPGAKTSVYKLRKLYARRKIRKKVVRIGKVAKEASLIDIAVQAAELSQDIQLALERRMRIC